MKNRFFIVTCLVIFIACGRHKPQQTVDTPTGNKLTTEAVQPQEIRLLKPEESLIEKKMAMAMNLLADSVTLNDACTALEAAQSILQSIDAADALGDDSARQDALAELRKCLANFREHLAQFKLLDNIDAAITPIEDLTTFEEHMIAIDEAGVAFEDAVTVYADTEEYLLKLPDEETLNEIRFEGWTKRDWFDNGYIQALRIYLDAYVQGEVLCPDLDPYKEVLRGKFAVWGIAPTLLGGVNIWILPIADPQNVLETWVYSEVQDDKVTGYSVLVARCSSSNGPISKEDMAEIIKRHPQMRLW